MAGNDGDKEMAANKENNNSVGASGSEEPGVAELLRSLMAKMDAQAQAEKMDAQAWEFREVVQKRPRGREKRSMVVRGGTLWRYQG